MENIAVFIWLVSLIMVIFNAVKMKKNPEKKKIYKKYMIVSIVICIIAMFIGGSAMDDEKSDRASNEKTEQKNKPNKKQLAKQKKQDEEKAKEESKKKRDEELDKKMDQEVKEARKKNDKKNLSEYKKALKSVPANSNNAITDAYIEKESSTTVAVLNDAALGYSSSELKNISHSAFNAMENIENKYLVRSNDSTDAPGNLEIRDSSGNVIAKRGLTGGFKYKGE